ncbi:PAAR domain-containing protein [Ralstonia pseudosolanacearum]|uniref:PAAR domain-containing protein n=1 Tax=Ralstonia pseudosolanacearum TaxID=1310165 RepID=UPI0026746296|nr:PAAR domain-containing protein [Ralstonia pseudosolanacearum]MDO3520838.1 PAAR domain-containing protein [Ralstonia pseudosolanacearum]MDO3545084.1 PAAR domain-containing protein [Ralstonia pseudosolanacearum]MDO3550047.1 PAAR domain-containing protein [Ralstonia pseudosolanacearum]MDO3568125.1 PAAR domain-containing protein [Ralstonia pseudosolanacearum]MDO3580445.1 PAAR domain-containing protein [Ralstonia pseudosolanacearum]
MPRVIRLGDPTEHGGAVVQTSAPNFKVNGVAVARKGDRCSCPREGHHDCVIIEGDEHFKVGGVRIAFEGHKTSCGATLTATVASFGTR